MAEGRCKPKPGDLIEVFRPLYQHWAIYVGKGYVIHVTDEGGASVLGSSSSISTKRGKVKKQLLEKVVKNDRWRVNNKYDRSYKPRPVAEIIQRAELWIGLEMPYDLLANNCEHFVTELRYGEGVSGQVEKAVVGTATAAGVLAGIAGVAAVTAVALSKGASRRQFD